MFHRPWTLIRDVYRAEAGQRRALAHSFRDVTSRFVYMTLEPINGRLLRWTPICLSG